MKTMGNHRKTMGNNRKTIGNPGVSMEVLMGYMDDSTMIKVSWLVGWLVEIDGGNRRSCIPSQVIGSHENQGSLTVDEALKLLGKNQKPLILE